MTKTLSVAIVRARYNPFGGAERFVQRALAALDSRVALTVVARRWPSSGEVANGLPIRFDFQRVDPFYLGSVWRDWSFARGVRKSLDGHRFDLIQSHERIVGMPIFRAGDGIHQAYLEQRLRAASRWRRAAIMANPHHAWLVAAERAVFNDPALRAVICNSQMVRREILSRFTIDPARVRIIRNGVDLRRFRPPTAGERHAARQALGLQQQEVAAVFVGSGFERKGLTACLHALALSEAKPALRLLVVGSDKRPARYHRLAQRLGIVDRVRWYGPQHDVVPYLHAADLFVLPSIYDPFPNAVLEALACGLPAITSTKSGAAEIIEIGRNGEVVDAFDHAGLARALARIATAGADERASMCRAARASAEPLSLTRLGDELTALYRQLICP